MAQMCGKRLKYLRNGFTMLEMACEFDKRLICGKSRIYVGNGSSIRKRLKNVGNGVDMWKMAQI